MEKVFSQHFQGTYKRPNTYTDLQGCIQKPDETMTDFVNRWISEKANCHGVSEAQAIHAFYTGLQKKSLLRHRLVREQITDLGEMLNLVAQYAAADDSTPGTMTQTSTSYQSGTTNASRRQMTKPDLPMR